ncbi:MAG: hypothetical protein AB1480_04865 [Nitrospirota bacterium]
MDTKTYYKTPRQLFWKMRSGIATPRAQRIPLEEAIRVTISWDTSYTFEELKSKIIDSPILMERLFTRSQTVDWILEMIGIDKLKEFYPLYKDYTREDLKREIELLL